MSDQINTDELWEDAVEVADAKRAEGLGGGLSENSVSVLKTVKLSTGGVMTRAAQGALGGGIRTRRITNVMILLDGSASMGGQEHAVVQGLNDMFDKLAGPKSVQRNSIEVTIWIFRNRDAEIFDIGGAPIINMPITQMPRVSVHDYNPSGVTPLNKTVLTAMGAGSLRAQQLANQRKGAMNYLMVATDGENNVWEEWVGNQKVTFFDHDVEAVSRDLLSSEEWILAYGYVGGGDAQQYADAIGFPLYANPDDWADFFEMASDSIQATSVAVQQPGNMGASQVVSQGTGQQNQSKNKFF